MSAHGHFILVRHRILIGLAIFGSIVGLAVFESDAAMTRTLALRSVGYLASGWL
jgi:hypothetical protein